MGDFLGRLGNAWGEILVHHPRATGLWIIVFFLGWVFQQAVKVRYANFDERPEWARWVVIFADCITTDFSGLVNNVFKRFPFWGWPTPKDGPKQA